VPALVLTVVDCYCRDFEGIQKIMKEDSAVIKVFAGAGVIALSALLGVTSYMIVARNSQDAFAACRSGNVAGGAIGGPFELVDESGATVTDAQVIAKPALVYFGYANCPDVCPLDNARNVEAVDLLKAAGLDVTPVFISVDPARDTPELLTEYTDYFGPTLLGLTGTPEQIKAAADVYKVFFQIPERATEYYEVQHTTLTYFMLPGTGFADFYQRDTTAQEIAERVGCFLKAS
jgi:protein SCO1/2